MPVLYKTIQATKASDSGKKLFHPRVVHIATISTKQLAREIAEYSSLSTGDVKNTMDNMITVMTKHLQSSESVTLDGLGTFSLILRSKGKGAETAAGVNAAQASLLVRFTPSYTRNQDRTTATRALITGVKCVPYSKEAAALGGGSDNGSGGNDGSGEDPLG